MFSTGWLLLEGDYSLSSLLSYKSLIAIVCRILKEGKSYDDLTEVAKLFNIHETEQAQPAARTFDAAVLRAYEIVAGLGPVSTDQAQQHVV